MLAPGTLTTPWVPMMAMFRSLVPLEDSPPVLRLNRSSAQELPDRPIPTARANRGRTDMVLNGSPALPIAHPLLRLARAMMLPPVDVSAMALAALASLARLAPWQARLLEDPMNSIGAAARLFLHIPNLVLVSGVPPALRPARANSLAHISLARFGAAVRLVMAPGPWEHLMPPAPALVPLVMVPSPMATLHPMIMVVFIGNPVPTVMTLDVAARLPAAGVKTTRNSLSLAAIPQLAPWMRARLPMAMITPLPVGLQARLVEHALPTVQQQWLQLA